MNNQIYGSTCESVHAVTVRDVKFTFFNIRSSFATIPISFKVRKWYGSFALQWRLKNGTKMPTVWSLSHFPMCTFAMLHLRWSSTLSARHERSLVTASRNGTMATKEWISVLTYNP